MRAFVQVAAAAPVALVLLLALVFAHQPHTAQAFTGGTGGFSLSELPEDLFDEDGISTTSSTTDFSDLSLHGQKSPARASGSRGSGLASHAAWDTLRTQGQKALLPSLVTAATVAVGATGRVLQKRYGSTVTRMWQERQEARQLRLEKRRLEREIKEEQRRYQQEMRRMTEEQEREEAEAAAAAEAEVEAEEEARRMRLREMASTAAAEEEEQLQQQQQQQQQQPQRYRPDLKKTNQQNQKASTARRSAEEWQATVAQLEAKVQALQGEVLDKADMASRAQSSRIEELNNARSVVEQLRKEVEEARGVKEHMQEQLRQYQMRLQTFKDQQEKNGGAASGGFSEEDAQRLRADVEAQLRQEYARNRAQEREALVKEVRHQTVAEVTAQSKAERSKYEADLVDLYRRRLKDEVAKRDVVMEERLHAQDVEYRRQCEELRMKVQGLLRDRDHHMREKVALHAREWQERVGSPGANNNKKQQQQQQQAPAQPAVRAPSGGGGGGGLFRRKGAVSSSSSSTKVVRGGGGGGEVPASSAGFPHRLYNSEGGEEEGAGATLMDAEEAEARAATRAVGAAEEEREGGVVGNEEMEERRRRRLMMLQRQRASRSAAAAAAAGGGVGGGSGAGSARRYPSSAGSRRERV